MVKKKITKEGGVVPRLSQGVSDGGSGSELGGGVGYGGVIGVSAVSASLNKAREEEFAATTRDRLPFNAGLFSNSATPRSSLQNSGTKSAQELNILRQASKIGETSVPLDEDWPSHAYQLAASSSSSFLSSSSNRSSVFDEMTRQPALSEEQIRWGTTWAPSRYIPAGSSDMQREVGAGQDKYGSSRVTETSNRKAIRDSGIGLTNQQETQSNPHLSHASTSPPHLRLRVEQGVGANCSVVTALDACVHHNLRFRTTLGQEDLTPIKVGSKGMCPRSKNLDGGNEEEGPTFFKVRLFVNGAWRYVLVDSKLPTNEHGHPEVCMHAVAVSTDSPTFPSVATSSSANSTHLVRAANTWIPVVEKAYMKLMGGYGFPGSTSDLDVLALTGWLPETLRFSDGSFAKERTWKRLSSAHRIGTALITLGTGKDVRDGLVPSHAYTVIGMEEDPASQARVMWIVNPWRVGRVQEVTEMRPNGWAGELREVLEEEGGENEDDTCESDWASLRGPAV